MTLSCRVTQGTTKVDRSRCAAVLRLRGKTLRDVASAAGVTIRHLHFVLAGQRPLSRRVASVLHDAMGQDGWLFATSQVHSLLHERADHAAS